MSRFHASRLPAATTALVHVALGGFTSLCGVASATRGGLRGKARHELESSNSNLSLTAFDLVVIYDKKKQGHGRSGTDSASIGTSLETDAASFFELNAQKKEDAKSANAQKFEQTQKTAGRGEGEQSAAGTVGGMMADKADAHWKGDGLETTSIDAKLMYTVFDDCKAADQACTVTTTAPPGSQPSSPGTTKSGKCMAYYGYYTNGGNAGNRTDSQPTPEPHGEMYCEALPSSVLGTPAEKEKGDGKEFPFLSGSTADMSGASADLRGPTKPWLHEGKEAKPIEASLKFAISNDCKSIDQECVLDSKDPSKKGKCVAYYGYYSNGQNPDDKKYHPTTQIHGMLYCEDVPALFAAPAKGPEDDQKPDGPEAESKGDAGKEKSSKKKTEDKNDKDKSSKGKTEDEEGTATRLAGISVVASLLPIGLAAASILQ
eukprot:CAMPEP_0179004714 /NCGR_PEP_ID=MMETSP0795-20121207/13474_1 /TAXON_ID=88552 /ORGANISM="Amoebophrya sp., Strain Ameob2" /LENGTH=430 /DNA_ID=CAMNT_0020699039 /DNA_START=91 /DNA_END=1383 /DNA_ORIENTATION=-